MNWLERSYTCATKEFALLGKAFRGNASGQPVLLYNFWSVEPEQMWLTRFLKHRGLNSGNKRISFYSVFGDRRAIKYDKRDVKVFITGENVHSLYFPAYSDNMLSEKKIDLAIGFDYLDDNRYVRMPLWLRTQFDPEWSEKEIIGQVQRLRYPEIGKRNKFAAMVARYDWDNTRSQIVEALGRVSEVNCPSKVLHNDDTLKSVYHDDKQAYLRQFHFNICPENSNYNGYVTEKVFDSVAVGCIPVYWGSDNQPEPGILNYDAMILWDIGGDNSHNVSKILNLWENQKELDEYMHQPRLKDDAEEAVIMMLNEIEVRFRRLLD